MSATPQQIAVAALRTHHPSSPSKMNYLDDCAAFQNKSGSSDAAERGTFLHDIMEEMLVCVREGKAQSMLAQMTEWVTTRHELEDDEIEALRFCARKVDEFLEHKPDRIDVETKIHVHYADGSLINSGYLDVYLEWVDRRCGVLIDYKFGVEPVRPARTNLQGMNYAAGKFEDRREVDRIATVFIQPKLGWVSEHVWHRAEHHNMVERLKSVIHRAGFVEANPKEAQQFMSPGYYCKYCRRAGKCATLGNHMGIATAKYSQLPIPAAFQGSELTKPEDIALARYWVDILENMATEIKGRAHEAAKASDDGAIQCVLPDGKTVRYSIHRRKSKRSLGEAVEVADALKEHITPGEILAAADLKITKLEPIVKKAMTENAKARGVKLSKKQAWEDTCGLLEALGLMTQPDTQVEYLKLEKSPERALPGK